MKWIIPMLTGFLLFGSGCGADRSKRSSAVEEEVRHPSNEMNLLPKEEPKREPAKKAAGKQSTKASRGPGFEDARRIPTGIDYGEMVRRFGPPTMRVTDSPSRITYSYAKVKMQVQVEVQNGKVVSVAAVNTGF